LLSREEVFIEEATKAVGEILPELLPTLRRESGVWSFLCRTEGAEISIGFNWSYISVRLRNDPDADFIELYDLLEILAPTMSEQERYPRSLKHASARYTVKQIRREVSRLALYGRPLMQGERTTWQRAYQAQSDFWTFRSQHEGETRAEWANRLRAAADQAYREKRYWTAWDLYLRIPGELGTIGDKWKFWQSSRHVFPMR
jgi:hypothetical protein